jgi:hypothetical protein
MNTDLLNAMERGTEAERKRESGVPGDGQDRKDEIKKSGVYPVSKMEDCKS